MPEPGSTARWVGTCGAAWRNRTRPRAPLRTSGQAPRGPAGTPRALRCERHGSVCKARGRRISGHIWRRRNAADGVVPPQPEGTQGLAHPCSGLLKGISFVHSFASLPGPNPQVLGAKGAGVSGRASKGPSQHFRAPFPEPEPGLGLGLGVSGILGPWCPLLGQAPGSVIH